MRWFWSPPPPPPPPPEPVPPPTALLLTLILIAALLAFESLTSGSRLGRKRRSWLLAYPIELVRSFLTALYHVQGRLPAALAKQWRLAVTLPGHFWPPSAFISRLPLHVLE